MLKIDLAHHLDVQTKAVAAAPQLRSIIAEELANGINNVFFASAGGVALLTYPAARLLQQHSGFPTYIERAAELIESSNYNLGPQSLVVFCSVSGTTKEAIDALKMAKDKGARVLSLTGSAGTPIAELADINITNQVADDTSSENYLVQSLIIALAILEYEGLLTNFDELVSELRHLPAALVQAKQDFEETAAVLANELAEAKRPILISSAGNTWYEAWYFGMCILEEMQWIFTRPIHASDFFHGTLELVEEGIDMLLLKGEDSGRALTDRVEAFVPRVGGRLHIIDTKTFDLAGISDELRALVAPAVLATVLERLSVHIETLRNHPLTTRRYYKQMEY